MQYLCRPRHLLLLFIAMIFLSCKKNTIMFQQSATPESWFAMHGGAFKDGRLQIQSTDGSLLSGNLDWSRIISYTFHKNKYYRVPYIFEGKKVMSLPNDLDEQVSFDLVLREANEGTFEAAILNTFYNAPVTDDRENTIRKNIESYHLLSGEQSTVWISDSNFVRKRIGKRIKSDPKTKNASSFSRTQQCETLSFTDRWVTCYTEEDYNTTCWINSHTTYVMICEDNEQNSDDWGGGGGSSSGGTGDLEIVEDGSKSVDCSSFQYVKTSLADWQEAGVNKIRLKWVWSGGNSGMPIAREIYINHIVFGLPTKYGNGKLLSAGAAANESAKILDMVKIWTYQEFHDSPYFPDDNVVINYFKTQLHLAMTVKGGTAGTTGTGSASIIFKDEERSFFNPQNCK